ncbi:MAG: DUF421 domain-containing protein [Nannocystaceae bacterium]|nr:DUF421 domain-containing protein [bacterium]
MFLDNVYADVLLRGTVLTSVAMVWIVVLVRIVGLRAFSKMTNFDFVMTVAVGSSLAAAGTADKLPAFLQALVVVTALFAVQFAAARLRKSSDAVESAMQNDPIMLMRDGEFIDDALESTRVSRSDLIGKLREANALDLNRVRAVVLEPTGDVSVLHGDSLDDRLLEGVRARP